MSVADRGDVFVPETVSARRILSGFLRAVKKRRQRVRQLQQGSPLFLSLVSKHEYNNDSTTDGARHSWGDATLSSGS
jgi:hypothetical protein